MCTVACGTKEFLEKKANFFNIIGMEYLCNYGFLGGLTQDLI